MTFTRSRAVCELCGAEWWRDEVGRWYVAKTGRDDPDAGNPISSRLPSAWRPRV